MSNLQDAIIAVSSFISDVLIPFLFALALVFFLYNALRFFILGSGEQEARDNAKRLALYGILAFVFLVSIWGIVNIFVKSLGIGSSDFLEPDYFDAKFYKAGESYEYCRLNPGATDCK